MARETGKILKVNPKGFAFASRDSGEQDVFVPPDQAKRAKVSEGDRVEFEVEPDPKKSGSFRTVSLTVLEKTQPSTPPTTPLGVTWKFGTLVAGLLPVMITVKRGAVAALDVLIKLMAQGKRISTPKPSLSPDASGAVTFSVDLVKVGLSADATQCVLTAEINGQLYSTLWEASKATPAPPATSSPKPERPTVERLSVAHGIYTYHVTVVPEGLVNVVSTVSIQFRKHGDISWSNQPIVAEADGGAMIDVQVTQSGTYGDVFFESAKLRSKPEYVVNDNLSAALKAPATT